MNYVKLLIAALLLYVAIKLWAPFFPDSLELFLRTWGVVLGIGLLAIGAGAAVTAIRSSLPLLKLGAAVALGLATFTLVEVRDEVAEASQEEGDIVWKTELNAALGDATARGTIALVDLSAEWCAACKELELHTFPDPAVQQRLRKMTVARLDFTIPNDETDRIGYKYRVQGLPTILFLRPNGEEIPNSRITGFMPPAAFEQHLAGVLARSSP
jgi:thiol:disulfide interchange protein DsbD